MKEMATGMAAAANVPAILWPRRPPRQEGAAPPPVTVGSRERGHGQGTIRGPAGSGLAERRGQIGGTPVKYVDPNVQHHFSRLHYASFMVAIRSQGDELAVDDEAA